MRTTLAKYPSLSRSGKLRRLQQCEHRLDIVHCRPRGSLIDIRFVNRFLVKPNEPWPVDANKLRLSHSAFESLRSHFQLSSPFLNALAHIQHPSPRSFPSQQSDRNLDFWFFVPVRVQVQCIDKKAHMSGSKGKSQMNPLNYLHLVHPDLDIRGSKIAVYYSFSTDSGRCFSLVFNFQDGRWKRVVEEPILRLRQSYRDCNSAAVGRDPIYLQTAILHSVLRWWNNALNSFNDQLIAYVRRLLYSQDESDLKVKKLKLTLPPGRGIDTPGFNERGLAPTQCGHQSVSSLHGGSPIPVRI